jgi:hypothetical protein
MTMTDRLPLKAASLALDLTPKELRTLIAKGGCPVARPGRRGRGGETLIDVAKFRAWMRRRDRKTISAAELSSKIEGVQRRMAAADFEFFRCITGPHKGPLRAHAVQAWYRHVNVMRAAFDLPELEFDQIPLEITLMRGDAEFKLPKLGRLRTDLLK